MNEKAREHRKDAALAFFAHMSNHNMSEATPLAQTSSTLLMGIVNVTPDSFSDGGQFFDPDHAIAHGLKLLGDGADILDIGAESTRPGAKPVSPEDEWQRLEPVLKGLLTKRPEAKISLDSKNGETILKALDYPIAYVNNVAGVAAPEVLAAIVNEAKTRAKGKELRYIAMHMWQSPDTMMTAPLDAKASLAMVLAFYELAGAQLRSAGLLEEQILLDPGIGFGKSDGGNLQLLRDCLYSPKRHNRVVGLSRKSLMGRLLGIDSAKDRDPPSKMFELALLMANVHAIRTHDIKSLHTLRTALKGP